jgi:hypothetical protein
MNKPRKHAELIKAWADGAEIEWFDTSDHHWKPSEMPCFADANQYRVKPPEFQHKWKKEIEAYTLHGKEVQRRTREEGAPWRDWIREGTMAMSHRPHPGRYASGFDNPNYEFRIKPEMVVVEEHVYLDGDRHIWFGPGKPNLRLTFEDGKLVAAEVIG